MRSEFSQQGDNGRVEFAVNLITTVIGKQLPLIGFDTLLQADALGDSAGEVWINTGGTARKQRSA